MYVKMASLAAMSIQVMVLLLIAFGRASEETFTAWSFQRIALLSICLFLLVLHRAGAIAYRYAVRNGEATAMDANRAWVALSPNCRFHHLVGVYLGFTGRIGVARVTPGASSLQPGIHIAEEAPP
jgi:type II secretory pathway component PulL